MSSPSLFQSTLPMKGATDYPTITLRKRLVSIHAPNEGSDQSIARQRALQNHVSIHAPNEGSDVLDLLILDIIRRFQSTLPMKGATKYGTRLTVDRIVSIHAPNEGSDV